MAKISKKHLVKIGFPKGPPIRSALEALAHPALARKDRKTLMALMEKLLTKPADFAKHEILKEVAVILQPELAEAGKPIPVLNQNAIPYPIFGEEQIEPGALHQMAIAAKLPVARAAALMPDAHQGYGLPIGGVLGVENAVIPYAVGVDIGCRMALSVFDLKPSWLESHRELLSKLLLENTTFGTGAGPDRPLEDPVLDRSEFQEIEIIRSLKDKAWRQIGSSGSGNHFVEFGIVEISDPQNELGVSPGQYVGLLSHSGSRGLGAGIAQWFTRLAMRQLNLPKEARHLAWLSLDSEEGQAYWKAMNLAGDYASACHNHIHIRIREALAETPLLKVENHHNFAWKESQPDGTELVVHRKGATPAGKGVLGIIPGSMVEPGYIVRGKGNTAAVNSASHGAGRKMSRSRAKQSITRHELRKILRSHRVDLIGGGLDEAPIAYKNIEEVMAAQTDLVEILGKFTPKVVRMAGD